MNIAWVMGWAVPQDWFAAQVNEVFPSGKHEFFEPTDTVLTELEACGPFDLIAGYSLGAHLLLAEAARVERLCAQVVLLAPFLAFPEEDGLGGRVARTQVRYLARWMRRDRQAALTDFYTRAGLNEVTPEMADGIAMETLVTGLTLLEAGRVAPSIPPGWRMYAGSDDSLLDATVLAGHLPKLVMVEKATHHPCGLLRAWKEDGL